MHRLKHAALQIMTGVKNFVNSKYLSTHWYDTVECLLKHTSPWNEAVNPEAFCGFLVTILFYKMNDSGTLPAPWFGFSRIINCLTYHISTASSHSLGTMVNRLSEGSLEPLLS